MGNASTTNSTANIVVGIKRSQENQNNKLYHLVDYQGEGELIQWMKYSLSIGDFNILDGLIELKVTPFLFAGGKGKLVPISELVKLRNDERNAMLSTLRRKKGKGKSGPNILDSINQENMQGDMMKALQMLDGGGKEGTGAKYRELCWSMAYRGVMGETLVHICLLNGTYLNNEVAKHLIKTFPKLVNDIYLSEEYYGQSALHQAIINEDLAMVRFLLRRGADVHQRCYGAFFCPDDQKETRCDSLEHEWVDVDKETNYAGRTYWGEYPLSFAACTRQPECFRLLVANKADPNMRDTNGNTVLHLMVIHELPEMFDLAYRLGAKLHVRNNQNLIPLTLAAKLAKKKMFDHVLSYEKQYLWTYGSLSCIAYPLCSIDTIEEETGKFNEISALSLITFAESSLHLMLFEGLVENLLEAKWKAFAKRKLAEKLIMFLIFYVFMCVTALLRPAAYDEHIQRQTAPFNCSPANSSGRCLFSDDTGENAQLVLAIAECCVLVGVVGYVAETGILIKRIGALNLLKRMAYFPGVCALWISFMLIGSTVVLRIVDKRALENYATVLAILFASFHFLFFLRIGPTCNILLFSSEFWSVKHLGPFIHMFYKMIAGDVFRFLLIYMIFLFGFSQAFFIIFLGCHREMNMANYSSDRLPLPEKLAQPFESMARVFLMSVGEFSAVYKVLDTCRLAVVGKIIFIVFEMIVSLMLINMLIASMTRTYEQIAETQMEWKRQWAKVIWILEQSLSPAKRLDAMMKYSRPVGTDRKKRAFVVMGREKVREAADEQKSATAREPEKEADISTKKKAFYKNHLRNELYLHVSKLMALTCLVMDLSTSNLLMLVCNQTTTGHAVQIMNPLTAVMEWGLKGSQFAGDLPLEAHLLQKQWIVVPAAKKPVLHMVSLEKMNSQHIRSFLQSAVTCIALPPDGSVCCAGVAEKIYTWSMSNGKLRSVVTEHYQDVTRLAFSSDSSFLVSASKDGSVVVWNVGDLMTSQDPEHAESQWPKPVHRWNCHSLPVTDLKVGHGGTTARIFSCSLDQSLKVHSLITETLILTLSFDCALTCCAVNNCETMAFVGTNTGDIWMACLNIEPMVMQTHVNTLTAGSGNCLLTGHSEKVNSLAVSMDGAILASASNDKDVRTWDIQSRQCLRQFHFEGPCVSVSFTTNLDILWDEDCEEPLPLSVLQKRLTAEPDQSSIAQPDGPLPDFSEMARDQIDKLFTDLDVDDLSSERTLADMDPADRAVAEKYRRISLDLYRTLRRGMQDLPPEDQPSTSQQMDQD